MPAIPARVVLEMLSLWIVGSAKASIILRKQNRKIANFEDNEWPATKET
jgi:hypothetical protein